MNLVIFASREVGLEIVRFVAGRREATLKCLVVDAADPEPIRRQIIDASRLPPNQVFAAGDLADASTLASLRRFELDLGILAWWPYIVRKPVIQIPRLGFLNTHPSYLPHNRGKHYNFWALVEQAPFGVTLHGVTEGVDAGDIAFQTRIATSWTDTGESLYAKAQAAMVQLFKDSFARIASGDIPRIPQDAARGSFHKASEIDPASEIKLDQSYTARNLLNLIRARTFVPHPGAWFTDGDAKYEVRIEIKKIDK